MEDINQFIENFVSSLTEDQCKAALKILKPLDRKMREEPGLASQLLEGCERELIATPRPALYGKE